MTGDPGAAMAAFMAAVLYNIETHGVHITGVFSTTDDPGPDFTYTTGLAEQEHPELIVFGLPAPVAGQILNDMTRRILDGHTYRSGQEHAGLLDGGVPLRIHALPPDMSARHLTLSHRLYATPDRVVPALQVVWPARADGGWPGEPDYPAEYAEAQPVFSPWNPHG